MNLNELLEKLTTFRNEYDAGELQVEVMQEHEVDGCRPMQFSSKVTNTAISINKDNKATKVIIIGRELI